MQVCVSGAGYVGLSNAVLLAQHNQVRLIDIVPTKVGMVNAAGTSPIEDPKPAVQDKAAVPFYTRANTI